MLGFHGIRYGIKNPEILKAELTALKRKINVIRVEAHKQWNKILESRDSTETLLFKNVTCKKKIKACSLKQTELLKIRNKIFKATNAFNKLIIDMDDCLSKEEALIIHLVSLVEDIDTKRGLETVRKKK